MSPAFEPDTSRDDLRMTTVAVPRRLLVSVERRGVATLKSGGVDAGRSLPISPRDWAANLALVSFCAGHLFWWASQVGLLP